MNIQTTYKGESVSIVETNINGHNVYITYIDSNNNLKVDQVYLSANSPIATSSTILE